MHAVEKPHSLLYVHIHTQTHMTVSLSRNSVSLTPPGYMVNWTFGTSHVLYIHTNLINISFNKMPESKSATSEIWCVLWKGNGGRRRRRDEGMAKRLDLINFSASITHFCSPSLHPSFDQPHLFSFLFCLHCTICPIIWLYTYLTIQVWIFRSPLGFVYFINDMLNLDCWYCKVLFK